MDDKKLWYGYKYYRGRLSSAEKRVYDLIYAGLLRGEKSFTIQPISPKSCTEIFNSVLLDVPACFHVSGFSLESSLFGCKIKPQYHIPGIQYQLQCQQVELALQNVLKTINCSDAWTMLKRLHSYIISHLSYEECGPTSHCIVGPLLSSKGVCEGIAKLVKYICDRLGLQSAVLAGIAIDSATMTQDNHAWNAVQIDGEWYCFDFTFDLTMNAGSPCKSIERYDYFALSSDEMALDHQCAQMVFPPCAQRKDYFTTTKSVVGCSADLRALISKRISVSTRDLAFKVSSSWTDFAPEVELNKAISLKAFFCTGTIGYNFSFNPNQRVCYVHFN